MSVSVPAARLARVAARAGRDACGSECRLIWVLRPDGFNASRYGCKSPLVSFSQMSSWRPLSGSRRCKLPGTQERHTTSFSWSDGVTQRRCDSSVPASSARMRCKSTSVASRGGDGSSSSTSESRITSLSMPLPTSTDDSSRDDAGVVSWKQCPSITPGSFAKAVGELCKVKLSGLVVASGVVGYAMAPGVDFTLGHMVTFSGMVVGTSLCVFSANSFNQWLEVPFDAQMKRTCKRPLVRGALRPIHALGMATIFGVLGTSTLYTLTNPMTAALGFGNIVLYAGVYTYMKRRSIANTWVGSVVGAIPPMMGWTAVTGSMGTGGWLLAATLFAWQFPHFNALSWNLRGDYSRAGYRMMSVVDPLLCKRVALRYSAAMVPIAVAFPYFDICSWWLAIDGTILNGFLTYRAWKFYQDDHQGSEQSARRLFFDTLWHLPAIMLLYYIHKKRDGNGPWYPMEWGKSTDEPPLCKNASEQI